MSYFGRTFPRLIFVHITKDTYDRIRTVTVIMTRGNVVFDGSHTALV